MWERLDSRLSPYRTPGAEGISVEIFHTVFHTVTFLRSPSPGGRYFLPSVILSQAYDLPKNKKIKKFFS